MEKNEVEKRAMALFWDNVNLEELWQSIPDIEKHIWRKKAQRDLDIYAKDQQFLDDLFKRSILSGELKTDPLYVVKE